MRFRRPAVLTAAAALGLSAALLAAAGSAGGPETLLGSWRMTEQHLGDGEGNYGRAPGLQLTFRVESGRLDGDVRWGRHRAPWPAFPTPDGPAVIDRVVFEPAADLRTARTSYRVLVPARPGRPPEPDTPESVLAVRETYVLAEDGRLHGTIEIRVDSGGEARGGITWRRIYEREASR